MEFRMSPWAYDLGVRGAYCCVHGLALGTEYPALRTHYDRVIAQVRERHAGSDPALDPVLSGFHALHAAVEADRRKVMSSPENLIRMIQKRGDLARINPLVDLYNLVSLETRMAL